MSVTLKIADEDAAVVASILRAVGTQPDASKEEKRYEDWFYKIRGASGHRTLEHLREIAGAFQIAVRANQR